MFIRLIYITTVFLNRTEEEFWCMTTGRILDLWYLHKEFNHWTDSEDDGGIYIDQLPSFIGS